jgi:hypothetical protein
VLAPIGTIKLRSPALAVARRAAALGCRAAAGAAWPAVAVCAPGAGRCTGANPALYPHPRGPAAGLSRPGGKLRAGHDRLAINRENCLGFVGESGAAAGPAGHKRQAAAAAFCGLPERPAGGGQTPGGASRGLARTGQKIVPPMAGAVISAAQNQPRTIAYLTREIKVG